MIYSQIEVEPRSNITLVLKMAGLAILRREFFYSIKEDGIDKLDIEFLQPGGSHGTRARGIK